MPVRRRTYNALKASLRKRWGQVFRLMREVRVLEAELAEERGDRQRLEVQLTEAECMVENLKAKVARLEALQRSARQGQVAEVNRLGSRIDRLARGCAGYRAELARERQKPGGSALELSERARRSLDRQIAAVQKSNEYMCRRLVDAAGTLKVQRPAGREPGVTS
ncbi:hypothetical protein ABZ419_11150 [Streptomyces cinnamoneus]|uniref:hypothetical protein n=1 Tax=Streptomyces cinnamoneus TaxID=53446 RepID=UPI0033D532DE